MQRILFNILILTPLFATHAIRAMGTDTIFIIHNDKPYDITNIPLDCRDHFTKAIQSNEMPFKTFQLILDLSKNNPITGHSETGSGQWTGPLGKDQLVKSGPCAKYVRFEHEPKEFPYFVSNITSASSGHNLGTTPTEKLSSLTNRLLRFGAITAVVFGIYHHAALQNFWHNTVAPRLSSWLSFSRFAR